jgi:dienelactone hydrolase
MSSPFRQSRAWRRVAFAVALLAGQVVGTAHVLDQMSILSPTVVMTSFIERGADGQERLELVVLWRGSPAWFLASGGSNTQSSRSRDLDRVTFTQGGLAFTLEYNRAKREVVLLGKTIDVSVNNVVFVDNVDSPAGARVTSQMRVEKVMPGRGGQIGLVLKQSPQIMNFLRCDAVPASGRGTGFVEKLCLQTIGANTWGQELVVFPTPDGANVLGHEYGAGTRAVVLVAHGGYSTMDGWQKQARALAAAGFRVLAFDTRAAVDLKRTGKETDCLYDPACMAADVLSAVRHLRSTGATFVAVVGGSAGGGAVAHAAVDAKPGEIDRVVLLAPMAVAAPEKMQGRKLFVVARDDANSSGLRLPGIRSQYERAPDPKELIVLDGSAHGQRVFDTPVGDALMKEILRFLSAK